MMGEKELSPGDVQTRNRTADCKLLLEKRESTSSLCRSQTSSSSKCIDESSDEHPKRFKSWHDDSPTCRNSTLSSARGVIYAASLAVSLLVLLSVTTTLAFHYLGSPGRLLPTTTSTIAVSKTVTSSSLAATISCPFQPSLQQQREGECVFDPMLLAWMPKPCMNRALLESTLNTTSEISKPPYEIAGTVATQIYADANLIQHLPLEEVQKMNQNPYYVTLRFHRAHCAYMFRLVAEAAGRKAVQDGTTEVEDIVGRNGGGNLIDGIADDNPKGVYVWQEAVRSMHVDHCVKVLAWREGDLDGAEKFFGSAGRCVLL